LRSWLRQEVLPILRNRLPDVASRLLQSGRQARSARAVLNAIPGLLPDLDLRLESGAISVAAAPLRGYRSDVRHAVLASLGRRVGLPLGTRRLEVMERLLSGSGAGRVDLGRGTSAELAYGRLAFYREQPGPEEAVPLAPGLARTFGRVRLLVAPGAAGAPSRRSWGAWFVPGDYRVRGWRPGDRIRPLGGAGSRAVSVLLREARIPPRERRGWPVVASADDATVFWVPGICRSDARIPEEGTGALHVECALA
jgi:tRNA(Ile)-lysidine synthetase-like protein